MATQEQEFRDQVKERYRFSDWAGSADDEPAVIHRGVELPDGLVEGWRIDRVHSLTESLDGVVAAARYVYARGEVSEGLRVMVRLYEYESPVASHEGLIDVVMTFMAPVLPRCESVGLEAGDVCFGAHGEVQTGAIFSRNNMLVHVESVGTNQVSVAPFLGAIDAILREAGSVES